MSHFESSQTIRRELESSGLIKKVRDVFRGQQQEESFGGTIDFYTIGANSLPAFTSA